MWVRPKDTVLTPPTVFAPTKAQTGRGRLAMNCEDERLRSWAPSRRQLMRSPHRGLPSPGLDRNQRTRKGGANTEAYSTSPREGRACPRPRSSHSRPDHTPDKAAPSLRRNLPAAPVPPTGPGTCFTAVCLARQQGSTTRHFLTPLLVRQQPIIPHADEAGAAARAASTAARIPRRTAATFPACVPAVIVLGRGMSRPLLVRQQRRSEIAAPDT